MRFLMTWQSQGSFIPMQWVYLLAVTLLYTLCFQGIPMVNGDKNCTAYNNTLSPCKDTCCCNQPQCCSCDTLPSSGLTFIPCDILTATPISPWPTLKNNFDHTDPLYLECDGIAKKSSSSTYGSSNPSATTTRTNQSGVINSGSVTQTFNGTDVLPTLFVPEKAHGSRQESSRTNEDSDNEDSLTIALVCLCVVMTILLITILIILIKKKNRSINQIYDTPRPMTPGPKSTFLDIPQNFGTSGRF